MKWAVFIVAVVAAIPAARWLRDRPTARLRAWTLVAFLPFFSSPLGMGLITFGKRAGDTLGLEVGLLDWLALSLLLAERRPVRPLPYRFPIILYMSVVLLSVTQAEWTLGALGYVWKLGRMLLLFASAYRAGSDPRVPAALLRGLLAGVVYEGGWVTWQHFGLRYHQATGTFAHQNTLAILTNLVVMVPVSLILAGRASWLPWAALLSAVPIAIFTVSRGAVVFFGAGVVAVYLVSTFRRFTSRKAMIGVVGLVAGLALVPVAIATLNSRAKNDQEESLLVRWRYEHAASLMLGDHPLGIGPNHFTTGLLLGGYGDRADVDWFNRVGIVHNIYWLTAAEMGYAGVVALVILLLAPIGSVIRALSRASRDRRADVLVGLGVGLLTMYAHSFLEWAWRITEVSYVFWICVAMVATLSRQVREQAGTNRVRGAGGARGVRRAPPARLVPRK